MFYLSFISCFLLIYFKIKHIEEIMYSSQQRLYKYC